MKDNPELQNKEVDKLKKDLEREKKQTTFLQSQLATLRTQMSTDLALIKNKEAQIKGNSYLNRLEPIATGINWFHHFSIESFHPKKESKKVKCKITITSTKLRSGSHKASS